jgi:hypothetical protein
MKSPVLLKFNAEFYQTIKEEPVSMLLKLFHTIEKEGVLLISFYKVNMTLIQKPDKNTAQNENYRSLSFMKINVKIFNKILTNLSQIPVAHSVILAQPMKAGYGSMCLSSQL